MFSEGIMVLSGLSAALLIVFGGTTDKLIPLFAIGVFGAFLFSQIGTVRHWLRKRGPNFRIKLFCNGIGAASTIRGWTAVAPTQRDRFTRCPFQVRDFLRRPCRPGNAVARCRATECEIAT